MLRLAMGANCKDKNIHFLAHVKPCSAPGYNTAATLYRPSMIRDDTVREVVHRFQESIDMSPSFLKCKRTLVGLQNRSESGSSADLGLIMCRIVPRTARPTNRDAEAT